MKYTTESMLSFLSYAFFFLVASMISIGILLGMLNILQPVPLAAAFIMWGIFSFIMARKFFNFHFPKIKINWRLLLPFGFLAAFLIVEFWNALVQPVWEYDSIAYHLPFVRHWITEGSLWKALFTPYTGPVGYYPGSGEILTLWNVIFLKNDLLANTQNIFLMIFFAVTAFDFGKKLGFQNGPALLIPLLFLHSPLILKEVGTPHIDLFFAYGFLMILYVGWDFIRTKKTLYLVPLGVAFGLFVGGKYLALPYAVIAAAALLFFLRKRFSIGFFLFGLIGFFLTGGFWYLRNFLLTGNPIFPAEVKLGSTVFFEGYGNMTEQILNWSLIKNLDTIAEIKSFVKQYLFRSGWQTVVFVISYVIGICFLFYKKSYRKTTLGFLVTLPLFFYLYLATPYTWNDLDANIRYSLLFLLVAAIFTAYLAHHAKIIRPLIYAVSAITILLTIQTALRTPDLPHELFNLNHFKQFPQALQMREREKFNILEHKYPNLAPLIHAFAWLEKNVKSGEGIAYSGFHFRYPARPSRSEATSLMRPKGATFQYISVNACADCNYVDFNNKEGGIFDGANREVWLQNLDKARIKYLILFDQIGYLKYEPQWVAELPRKFEKVFEEGKVNIFHYAGL